MTVLQEDARRFLRPLATLPPRGGGRPRGIQAQSLVLLGHEASPESVHALRRFSDQFGVSLVLGASPSGSGDVKALAGDLVNSLERGIAGTTVRAGMIGEVGDDVRFLRAAARAHIRTAAGIAVRAPSDAGAAHRCLDILEADGVDLRRVALTSVQLVPDHADRCGLAVRGIWLGYDSTDDAAGLRHLVDAGWAGQLLLYELGPAGLAGPAVIQALVDGPRRFLTGE